MFSSWRCSNTEQEMAGQTIVRVTVSADDLIRITTDKGVWELQAEGDCCSDSFFLNPNDMTELTGKTITGIEVREEPRDRTGDEECRQEESIWYGAVFSYAGGSVYLEMRNDSNGYYGGMCNVTFEARE